MKTTLASWLLERIAEDEREAEVMMRRYAEGAAVATIRWRRVMTQCEAYRKIVELHEAWPVFVSTPPKFETLGTADDLNSLAFHTSLQMQWLTQEEYRKRFGEEPPTAPMLRALAAIYRDRSGWREEWA